MKFGKSIGSQQEGHADLYYVDYKLLKKRIKDVVAAQQARESAEALTANTAFEEELALEIRQVNDCFASRQRELLERTGCLAEELQGRWQQVRDGQAQQGGASSSSACCPAHCGAAATAGGEDPASGWAASGQRPEAFRTLVGILGEVDQLRKYAVWNAVAVVKILKKRRKQTDFGLEDTAVERASWLSRQSFFSGSDFAELHAAIESLGHMLVLSELAPGDAAALRQHQQPEREMQQCPICLDTISDMVELSCSHRFCWKCFVLGPIAHQPGEYRITQCPICRRETSPNAQEEGESCDGLEGVCVPSSEGLLTRFLHTYFPQEGPQQGALGEEGDEQEARREGERAEREMRDVVGELVKALLADAWKGPLTAPEVSGVEPREQNTGSAGSAVPSDFFQTLPQKPQQEKQLMGAAQKLQWLQLASTGDPLALDGTAYCSLCSEPLLMEVVVTTPCKHHFHRVCINRLDMPQCPLCTTNLPFSWFLPADHPCVENGFRVVAPRNYRPQFAGGPSRGTCGYPLRNPPPMLLYSADGLVMKSYLHRVHPTQEAECDTPPNEHESSPLASPLRRPADDPSGDAGSSASESSSEDSGSEADVADKKGVRKFAYSAVGRMRLVPAPAHVPTRGPCAAARSSTSSASASGEVAGGRLGEQRNPTVLLIGDHV